MSHSASGEPVPLAVGWYGKLPSRGDFLGDGLPHLWLRAWDGWLQLALADATGRVGASLLRERLMAMSPWQCLVLPDVAGQRVWSGIVTASTDRVGRVFPLMVAEAYDEAALESVPLACLNHRARRLVDLLRNNLKPAPSDIEHVIAQWIASAWPPLDIPADSGPTVTMLRQKWPQGRSFWWRLPLEGGAIEPLTEPWPPSHALLLEWLAVTD